MLSRLFITYKTIKRLTLFPLTASKLVLSRIAKKMYNENKPVILNNLRLGTVV